jgi:hypothetical protein
MAKRMRTETEKVEQELQQHLHPPQSKAAQQEERALDTLAALLDSQDETIRLQAAQAILNRTKVTAESSMAGDIVKTITKAL